MKWLEQIIWELGGPLYAAFAALLLMFFVGWMVTVIAWVWVQPSGDQWLSKLLVSWTFLVIIYFVCCALAAL